MLCGVASAFAFPLATRSRFNTKGDIYKGVIMEGWISLHRKTIDSAIYKDSEAVHLWVHLLLMANHKPNQAFMDGKPITVKSGQLITGRKALSVQTGISESKIQRLLKKFQKCHMIEQQTTTKNRLISITNYEQYQKPNNKRTAGEQQANTNNNDNNEINNIYTPEFNELWSIYPRKEGANKKAAFKAYQSRIKSGASNEQILAGVKAYRAYCLAKGTEQQYMKQAQTFFGPSEHYLVDWSIKEEKPKTGFEGGYR